jgi:hypothetical protein
VTSAAVPHCVVGDPAAIRPQIDRIVAEAVDMVPTTTHLTRTTRLVALVAIVASSLFGAVACSSDVGGDGRTTTGPLPTPPMTNAPATNAPATSATTALGILEPRINGVIDVDHIATEAKLLGVSIVRTGQLAGGSPNVARAFADRELRVQMDIRAAQWPATPPATPDALAQFQDGMRAVLHEFTPALIAVENEETVDAYLLGSPGLYLGELRAAVKVANERGVPVTNGGLPFPVVGLLTWNHLRLNQGTAAADAFLASAFDNPEHQWMARDLVGMSPSVSDPWAELSRPQPRQNVRDGEFLVEAYGSDPGDVDLDFVNIHWYWTGGTFDPGDAAAFRHAVTAFREMTGRPVVTNELGSWVDDPAAVTGLLEIAIDELSMPFVIWYDADDREGIHARALHDHDPSLRPFLRSPGAAFAQFVDERS